MKFRRGTERSVTLDITPLVDVVFLLLIFFMVTTSFSPQQLMGIDPPKARTGAEIEGKPAWINIAVDKAGHFLINGVAVEASLFRKELLNATGGHSERLIAVEADKETPHGAVVFALDEARFVGAKRLAITIHPVSDQDSSAGPTQGNF
ncbi:MAG: biopolymer transporter ExbD [Magnetococcales bacterium]|nr:biopolymer transporter ExbD [Magnetococcales bacterium]